LITGQIVQSRTFRVMTSFIIIAASLALACNAIETGECVLGSEASCGGSDSSALLQGRLRVNEDAKAVEISINADLVVRREILTFTVLAALTNVTRASSKVGFRDGYPDESVVGAQADWEALHSNTEGLRKVMTAIGAGESCPAQSADGDYSHLTSIKMCVDHALCIMCQNVTTQEDNKACTMLRELYGNFEDTTWGYLWKSINLEKVASEDSSKGIDYMDPTELACKGIDFDEEPVSFGQINLKATAHQASAALVDAARTTHALLDSHQENHSGDATIAALHRAWEPPCKLLNCDHTNYWDLVGASFSHSIALIESGASSHHMQVHLRTRQRLEIRMGAFLAANGREFASKIYRTDGTSSEAQMNRYVSNLVVALTQKMTNFVETHGPDSIILSLYDRDHMKKLLRTPAQARLLQAFYDREDFNPLGAMSTAWKATSKAVKTANKAPGAIITGAKTANQAYVKAVNDGYDLACTALTVSAECNAFRNAIQEFVRAAIGCLGAGIATATGYGRKFPDEEALRGMAINVNAAFGNGASLKALLRGEIANFASITFSLGVLVGAIPGGSGWSGGVRVGVGIAVSLSCSMPRQGYRSACVFGISVGAVTSGIVPGSEYSPHCRFGPELGGHDTTGFGCFTSVGVTFTMLCCTIDVTNGCQSCDPNETNCGSAEPAPIDQQGNNVGSSTIRNAVEKAARWANFCVEQSIQYAPGSEYMGCQTKTKSGRTCQVWALQSPHRHGYDQKVGSLNSCRNPSSHRKNFIWCYTEDPRKRWETCNILHEKTCGGSARGRRCKLPMMYRGKRYDACTSYGWNQPWCYTVGGGWGNCLCQGTSGGNANGAKCKFPTVWGGKSYHSCVIGSHYAPWCYTGGGRWGNCIVSTRGVIATPGSDSGSVGRRRAPPVRRRRTANWTQRRRRSD